MKNGTFFGPENGDHAPSGIIVDGAACALQGQPPTAVSHGWGDMSWARSPYGYHATLGR